MTAGQTDHDLALALGRLPTPSESIAAGAHRMQPTQASAAVPALIVGSVTFGAAATVPVPQSPTFDAVAAVANTMNADAVEKYLLRLALRRLLNAVSDTDQPYSPSLREAVSHANAVLARMPS